MTAADIEATTGLSRVAINGDANRVWIEATGDQAAIDRATAAIASIGVDATAEAFAAEWAKTDPNAVPGQIEARLLRKWLILHGHSIASIDAAIAAIADPVERDLTANEWEYSTSYTRRHPMFPAFVKATGLSDEQIDQAFREAAGMV